MCHLTLLEVTVQLAGVFFSNLGHQVWQQVPLLTGQGAAVFLTLGRFRFVCLKTSLSEGVISGQRHLLLLQRSLVSSTQLRSIITIYSSSNRFAILFLASAGPRIHTHVHPLPKHTHTNKNKLYLKQELH